LYNTLVHGPSKIRKVPFLWGDSNSGKTTVLKAIKKLLPTATHRHQERQDLYLRRSQGRW
jgi:recombinational DNA repair ATPase RecF